MLPITQKLIYFLYVRKSTDVEDKQVLSIAAQITELKEFAARMGIYPRFYVSTSKSIIKALINMRSFEIQLSPIG